MNKTKTALILLILSMFLFHPQIQSWADASRLAAVESIVEHHSLIIDNCRLVVTGDKVFVNGHFYSDKPIMASILGAVVYFPLYHIGLRLDHDLNAAYYLITLLTVKLFLLLGIIAFYKSLRFAGRNETESLAITAMLTLCSLLFTWSTFFNNHSLAASFLMIGFYFILRNRFQSITKMNILLAGTALAMAGAVDMPVMIFYVGFGFYILLRQELRKYSLFYALPLLFTIVPTLAVNYYISGSIMPLQIKSEYFIYPGSPWNDMINGLSGVERNSIVDTLIYSFNMLFGNSGFFTYTPLLFFAFFYMIKEIVKRRSFQWESLVIAICSIIFGGYYLMFTNNYGGYSYSIRWFVPLLPLFFFFLYQLYEKHWQKLKRIIFVFSIYSLVIAMVGAIRPANDNEQYSNDFLSNIDFIYTRVMGILHR